MHYRIGLLLNKAYKRNMWNSSIFDLPPGNASFFPEPHLLLTSSVASMLAPPANKRETTSEWPSLAAACRGV